MSTLPKDVLIGFVEEVRSYLPEIEAGTAAFVADPTQMAGLEAAYRHAHTIKGASSMIGLAALSHIAYYLEETLERVVRGEEQASANLLSFVQTTVAQIDSFLDGTLNEAVDERTLLTSATEAYHRVQGLPDGEVAETVEAILEELDAEPIAVSALPSSEFDTIDVSGFMGFDDELSAELQIAFQEEASDHMQNIQRLVKHIEQAPDNEDDVRELRRVVHTLKGAAATVGIQPVAKLTHRMEDLLDTLDEAVTRNIVELLYDSADALEDLLEGNEQVETLPALYAQYDNLLIDVEKEVEVAPLETIDFASLIPTPSPQEQVPPAPVDTIRTPSEVVRVPLERIDELVRTTSEFVITRSTFEQRLNALSQVVGEFAPSLERLQRLANQIDIEYNVRRVAANQQPTEMRVPVGSGGNEFDLLEFDHYDEAHIMSRELVETTSDVRAIHNELRALISDFESLLTQQGRLSRDVQDRLMRIRMVPLATITTRLQRAVRVVARKQSKDVNFEIQGEAIELDKQVLEEMVDPLVHILRNAVDHGIEPTELRQVMGKPVAGTIKLHAYYEGNQVVLEISDDGAGIDPAILQAKAVSNGYITQAEAEALSAEDLYNLVFVPGFSTATQISEISGRGVGLDVVKDHVQRLKGTVSLESSANQGTTFTIRLPMTLAVIRALLVESNHETFAIPLTAVSQILRLERDAVATLGHKPVLRLDNKIIPLRRLGEILQLKNPPDEKSKRVAVLVMKSGNKQIGLVVDQIVEGREIVIKSLGNHLRHIRAVSGATLMGDGSVVLILNPPELVSEPTQTGTRQWTPRASSNGHHPNERIAKTMQVMVVDDSLSVRKVVSNVVKGAGWKPIPARDGMEALELIQRSAELPDAIILDVEMPRMNGYELATTLRANARYSQIPIVMLTSRAGAKHRQKAYDVGVSEYLTKPYQDEVLINVIHQLTQK